MIQNLISPLFDENEVDLLTYVNPYWAKELNRYVKKANLWTHKFRGNNEHYVLPLVYSNSQIPDFSRKLSEYKNYLMQRYEMIKTNLRFVRKFNKWIVNYTVLVGMVSGLKTMTSYYSDTNTNDYDNKILHFISIANKTSTTWFDKYKGKIESIIKHDEFVQMVFRDIVLFDEKLNTYDQTVMEILGYSRKLFKKKKLTENNVVNITVESLEFLALCNSFNFFAGTFAKKIR